MKLFILTLLFLPMFVLAKPIRIGILDSGYLNYDQEHKVHFCEDAKPVNYTSIKMHEDAAHGNNVLHLIVDDLPYNSYCVVLIKGVNSKPPEHNEDSIIAFIKAYNHMTEAKVDIINLSIAGYEYIESERIFLKNLLDKGVIIVIAAGNERLDLSRNCRIYPACTDSRAIVVGSINEAGNMSKFTDYGIKNEVWEIGEHVYAGGYTMSGTSQATAKRTHKIVLDMMIKRKHK